MAKDSMYFKIKNYTKLIFITLGLLILISCNHDNKYLKINSIKQANQIANIIHAKHQHTFYCGCSYNNKIINLQSCGYKVQKNQQRAKRLEWEHIVPVSKLAANLPCWKQPICCKQKICYRGRACCQKIDPYFIKMATDLHNIVPEIGELNGIRSNYAFTELPHIKFNQFGLCKFKVDPKNRKVEANHKLKGIIARTYLHMNDYYHLNFSITEQKLFHKWNRQYPPEIWEINWNKKVLKIQGIDNKYISNYAKYIR